MIMDLRNKDALVVGFGKTGAALVRFLHRRGARVSVTEKRAAGELGKSTALWKDRGVRFETGGHTEAFIRERDLILLSPGVPPHPAVAAAERAGTPILSEIELAGRFLRGTIVAVTGTNGKSTTATLIHRILTDAGRKSFLAGNIGTPLISFVEASSTGHVYVIEISSFQLEYTERFRPDTAVFLNITENHIDWHGSFEAYFDAKKKLFSNMSARETAVLNRDDARVWAVRREGSFQTAAFSRKTRPTRGVFIHNGWIVLNDGGEKPLIPLSDIRLPGTHNHENVMAAVLTGHLLGVSPGRMKMTIRAFQGLEHRLENVLTFRGVRFINDSKATTVDAALKALAAVEERVVLILGGRAKGGDFRPLRPAVRKKAARAVLVGEAAGALEDALKGAAPLERASSFRDAVRRAFAAAEPGQVVLLAPACTSWDMFRSFEERGRVFKNEVRKIARISERKKA